MRRKIKSPNSPPRFVRVIGGQWRGRKLPVLSEDGLRPTGDRVKETLFNWLAPWLDGMKILDMFSGTGSLGFEALSRGAKEAVLCECNQRAATQLIRNANLLDANAQVYQGSSFDWLASLNTSTSFDLVLIDPPFAEDIWDIAITRALPYIKVGGFLYVERPTDKMVDMPSTLELYKSKRAGILQFELYRRL